MIRFLYIALGVLCLLETVGCQEFDHAVAERNHLAMIGLACENYEAAWGEYPKSVQNAEFIAGETLADEWATEIRYLKTSDGYLVVSAGTDKVFDTLDDIKLSSTEIQTWNQE